MEPGKKRKRIEHVTKGTPAIEDDKAYVRNKCSERAKRIKSVTPNLVFEIWYDQHYQIRQQFGDDNGERRGIEAMKVESLLLRSMKHLVAYGSILNSFTFINHDLKGGRANRIVLQEQENGELLNVVIEAHLFDISTYEITVKTAMQNDSFSISDGQFSLELIDNESVLRKMERGHLKEIYAL